MVEQSEHHTSGATSENVGTEMIQIHNKRLEEQNKSKKNKKQLNN